MVVSDDPDSGTSVRVGHRGDGSSGSADVEHIRDRKDTRREGEQNGGNVKIDHFLQS
jgi:hypothetical protein